MAKRARVEPPRAHDEPVTLSLVRDSIMVIVMAKETRRPPGGLLARGRRVRAAVPRLPAAQPLAERSASWCALRGLL